MKVQYCRPLITTEELIEILKTTLSKEYVTRVQIGVNGIGYPIEMITIKQEKSDDKNEVLLINNKILHL